MAKSLYSALFDWIVLRINHALLNKKDMEEAVSVSAQVMNWARTGPILGTARKLCSLGTRAGRGPLILYSSGSRPGDRISDVLQHFFS